MAGYLPHDQSSDLGDYQERPKAGGRRHIITVSETKIFDRIWTAERGVIANVR
jgi:hypothetical protein